MTEKKQGAAEWLRGIVKEYKASGAQIRFAMAKMFGIDCEYETCKSCMVKLMTAIADRIDAERALPEGVEWPRFEDGELVKIGDEVECGGKALEVDAICFDREEWSMALRCNLDISRMSGSYDELVKRPTPKVLGADGVPIEVGDVVYYDGEPHPLTVVGITRDGKDALVDANGEESCVEGGRPQDFSHEAPKPKVLDADGVPIEVGDTVWCDDGDEPLRVTLIHTSGYRSVSLEGKGGEHYSLDPERLTHKRPDSWERLEEDAKGGPTEYARDILGVNVRTTTTSEDYEAFASDIVRRAKALAKAGEEA